jgi:hypothetical protein
MDLSTEPAQSAASGPKPRRDLQAYLDETGLLQRKSEQFFGLGLVTSPNINTLHREIINFRNRAKYHNEFKFTMVSQGNILYYKGLLDVFFSVPNNMFSCFIYDKSASTIVKHNRAYNAFCGHLIADQIIALGVTYTNYITILADDVSTPKADHFEREIRGKVRRMTRRNAVTSIIRLESHAVTEIQLCDVLLGCVAYAYKVQHGLVKPNKEKLELVKHLQKKIGVPALSTPFDRHIKNGITFKVTEKKAK